MKNIDQLIEKFNEFKEELNKSCPCGDKECPESCPCPKGCKCKSHLKKNMNMSQSMAKPNPNPTIGTSGGEGGMYRSEDAKKSLSGMDEMAMSEETLEFDKNGQWKLDKSAFKTLQHKIEREGHSKESAGAITAAIGRKELGQKEMTARSKAGVDKVDPQENINIPHPQGKAQMSNGVNKEENIKLGTNQRLANPPEKMLSDGRGKVHHVAKGDFEGQCAHCGKELGDKTDVFVDGSNKFCSDAHKVHYDIEGSRDDTKKPVVKDEGTNEESNPSKPHNKGKFKVMEEVTEKESKKEKIAGKPYNGDGGSAVHKGDKCKECSQSPCKCGNAENKFRHGGFGL
jgi:hypothetical protein